MNYAKNLLQFQNYNKERTLFKYCGIFSEKGKLLSKWFLFEFIFFMKKRILTVSFSGRDFPVGAVVMQAADPPGQLSP